MFDIKKHNRLFAKVFLILLVSIFFARLYFPLSLFTTPDFGLSDLLHFNLPLKYSLTENLKLFKLPLWEDSIGQGYPLFADGFAGTLYIPNLIIFFILPLKLALPTMYMFSFSMATIGMFMLLKHLKISTLPSLFGSIAFTFSAILILRVQHINVLEANSLLPIVLLFYLKFIEKLEFKKMLICALVLSQLFMTGYLQIFVYCFLILFILGLVLVFHNYKTTVLKFLILFTFLGIFTILLSSIQLLPQYELSTKTDRGSGLTASQILNNFPISYKNLLTFFNPFIFGKASNGTHNSPEWDKVGIFWESTAYIGIIPFFFCLLSLALFTVKGKNFRTLKPFIIVFIISILLALGKNSPLLILYSMPPLNYFRVPSRFLIFSQLFAIILATYTLQNILTKYKFKFANLVLLFLIFLTIIDLWSKWWNYNPIQPFKWIAEKPASAKYLNLDNDNYRIYTLFPSRNWNQTFLFHGWENRQSDYKFFLNSLDANLNTLYNINQFSVYSTQRPRRKTIQESIVHGNINIENYVGKINPLAEKILSQASVKYLVSTVPLESTFYEKITEISKDNFKYFIYEGNNINKRIAVYYNYATVSSPENYASKTNEVDTNKTVILEEDISKYFDEGNYEILTYAYSDTHVEIEAKSDKDGLLVLSDSYYPDWKATIDSQPTKIYPANINSRAIILPEGQHRIKFYYSPNSVKTGALLSLFSFLLLIILYFAKWNKMSKAFKVFRGTSNTISFLQKKV